MKSIRYNVLLLALISVSSFDTWGQSTTKVDEQIIFALSKYRAEYCASMLDAKTDRLQQYYSDTLRLMPPFQKTVLGKINASAYYNAFTDRFMIHAFNLKEVEVLDLGLQVMEIGVMTMRMTLKSAGKEFDVAGKYLNLWVKTKNNGLRLLTQAWNFDQYYADLHDHVRFENVPSVLIALKPNVLVTNDIQFELAALNRLLDATITNHDGNTWSLYYCDDAILMASYYPMNVGRKEIDNYIQKHTKELPTFEELDIRNDRIDDLGNYIVEYASHIAAWKNGDRSGVGLGKNIRIWRREPNHALKLFRSISMYD